MTKAERRVVNAALKWAFGIRYMNDPKYPIEAYPRDQHPLLRAVKALRKSRASKQPRYVNGSSTKEKS